MRTESKLSLDSFNYPDLNLVKTYSSTSDLKRENFY